MVAGVVVCEVSVLSDCVLNVVDVPDVTVDGETVVSGVVVNVLAVVGDTELK